MEDSNSYWSVRGTSDALCHRGTPVKCGQTIRLTHVNTGRNLHSHYFASPLSSNQVGGGRSTREKLRALGLCVGFTRFLFAKIGEGCQCVEDGLYFFFFLIKKADNKFRN